jgi:hypothetical protein
MRAAPNTTSPCWRWTRRSKPPGAKRSANSAA